MIVTSASEALASSRLPLDALADADMHSKDSSMVIASAKDNRINLSDKSRDALYEFLKTISDKK